MDPILFLRLLLLLVSLSACPVCAAVQPATTSHMTVTGSVFCDVCYDNSFTKHSYFLPGADVHVQCKFEANAPSTKEVIGFSVNRTTNRYGVYRLDIPSVEGVDCVEGPAVESRCEATLIKSSVPGCNVPGVSTTTKEITVKSKSTNLCVYSVSALSYRPLHRNSTLCPNNNYQQKLLSDSFNSSKFFLPWPLPQLPPLPPFPSFPPPPSLQYPYPPPNFSRPPVFNLGDPRTWIPNIPSSNPLPPPPSPRNWTPQNPFFIPRPPSGFDLRTWIPTFPPSPNSPQNQQP